MPVEAESAEAIETALRAGRLTLPAGQAGVPAALVRWPPPPAGAAAILARDAAGACVFLDRADHNRCAVHRALGHERLPDTCRHFPRIALLDGRGVHVTLSHFCPTAASMLLREDIDELRIVSSPDAFAANTDLDGFDATGTVPPFVRPGVVFDLDAYARWEAWQIEMLGRPGVSAEDALGVLARTAETLRGWTPTQGPLLEAVAQASAGASGWVAGRGAPGAGGAPPLHAAALAETFSRIVAEIRSGLPAPEIPADLEESWTELVEPAWRGLSRPVRRYLGSKAFAAWSAYQGEGIRTSVAVIGLTLDALKVESARQAARADRPLDRRQLTEAIRRTDLLLEHLVDRADLARLASPAESRRTDEFLSGFPL